MAEPRNLIALGKRVAIRSGGKTIAEGWLHELNCSSVLPQYFAVLDDGTERDLRNDVYSVVGE